jgi:ergothioneine biosynthesis protein EgtB
MDFEAPSPADLLARYGEVRGTTARLCEPLSAEDMLVQSMPQASPTKWHLAHTTWFFEAFVLAELPGHRPFHESFGYLFNSYYNALGDRLSRPKRGLLSRPSLAQVMRYREHVDGAMRQLLASRASSNLRRLTLIGLHHEQQHQELILTDIKHALGGNPLKPSYRDRPAALAGVAPPLRWMEHPGGLIDIGHAGAGFAYDNETPRHRVFLRPFRLASRLATCGDYMAFLDDGGYSRPELWLSDGWDACQREGWQAPLYWEKTEGRWWQYTLAGPRRVREDELVIHVSFYEADAFARWSGARLPTEAEWEAVAADVPVAGSFLDADRLHPAPAEENGGGTAQLFGEAWQWTASPYVAYPGYRTPEGALGEYNGKFMCNQLVLRGGSCLTPRSHFRRSYRNFFPPDARWQFSGVRLARDL